MTLSTQSVQCEAATSSKIEQNAKQLGIALSYYDLDGNEIATDPKTLEYFTALLTPKAQEQSHYSDVIVTNHHQQFEYDLSKLGLNDKSKIAYQLCDEQQQIVAKASIESNQILLPKLPYGYYELSITQHRKKYGVRVFVQPKTAFQPPILKRKKAWGLNVQLYSLRSGQNWGIGDFGDLRQLIESAVKFGADFVGINPLHMLFPSAPEWASPYSASSRRWLNAIYLDVPALPEFKRCKNVQNWVIEQGEELARLRALNSVDYKAVNALKMTALRQLFDFFKRSKAPNIVKRREQFAQYQKSEGEPLISQALFNVLDQIEQASMPQNEEKIGWLNWREEWQQLTPKRRVTLLNRFSGDVEFYAWLQWLAQQQLAELQALCQKRGMKLGIYGDLAVQSACGSADVWSDAELYCVNAAIGAPPDPLGPVGQNWGLPPYNPSELKARGFQPFIEMLRANMQHFGALRIDHVMGLFRLWLIPENQTAAQGCYVHYPFDALMAILAIESQRNKCLIIGEDLGIVPQEVRSKLTEFQILSYFVLYFEQRYGEFPKADEFPLNAFATIGTHDVASLQSFWHCRDLELFGKLGVLQGEALQQKYNERVQAKQALLNSLHRDGYLPPDYQGDAMSMAMHDNLIRVIHQYIADSQSQLIGVQLENLISQEISFNLPGTSTEYPNWRNKLALDLEQIFNNERIVTLLQQINQARSHL